MITQLKQPKMNIRDFISEIKTTIDARLNAAYPEETEQDSLENSYKAMRYMLFLGGGGKRIRSAITIAAARACGGTDTPALPYAQAIEEIHSYTLMEDDIVDDDDFRRGNPTTHMVYGINTTLMGASRLYERGLLPFHRLPDLWQPTVRTALDLLHRGQTADLDSPDWQDDQKTLKNLQFIQSGKTSGLFKLSLLGGAYSANATDKQIEALLEYGHWLGLAFQAQDDILSATVSAEQLGKPVGDDSDQDKFTFVTFQPNIKTAQKEALKLAQNGQNALDTAFKTEADPLRQLIEVAITRKK